MRSCVCQNGRVSGYHQRVGIDGNIALLSHPVFDDGLDCKVESSISSFVILRIAHVPILPPSSSPSLRKVTRHMGSPRKGTSALDQGYPAAGTDDRDSGAVASVV